MGLSCGAARVPLILVLAARYHLSGINAPVARLSSFVQWGTRHWVVSVTRPDLRLRDRVPSAEFEVARLLVEGKSHLEIAGIRGTSQRTVANQLSSVFRRLDVSGRLDLLNYVVTWAMRRASAPWFSTSGILATSANRPAHATTGLALTAPPDA
jgi:DNA-binding CsgD family transcriptional regulator